MGLKLRKFVFVPILALAIAFIVLLSFPPSSTVSPQVTSSPIKHVVVMILENHTFDNLFGTFPGANGVANDTPAARVNVFTMTTSTHDLCHSQACITADYDGGKMDGPRGFRDVRRSADFLLLGPRTELHAP